MELLSQALTVYNELTHKNETFATLNHAGFNNVVRIAEFIRDTKKKRTKKQFKATDQELEILNFLNDKAGKAFKPVEANIKFIRARLAEGYEIKAFRQVVAKKCREWKGTDQEKYLRPETLFNQTKFASYTGGLV